MSILAGIARGFDHFNKVVIDPTFVCSYNTEYEGKCSTPDSGSVDTVRRFLSTRP